MAVQKSKKTRSKIGMRRSHDKLSNPQVSLEKATQETHLSHFITKEGYYKGKLVKFKKSVAKESNSEAENT